MPSLKSGLAVMLLLKPSCGLCSYVILMKIEEFLTIESLMFYYKLNLTRLVTREVFTLSQVIVPRMVQRMTLLA